MVQALLALIQATVPWAHGCHTKWQAGKQATQPVGRVTCTSSRTAAHLRAYSSASGGMSSTEQKMEEGGSRLNARLCPRSSTCSLLALQRARATTTCGQWTHAQWVVQGLMGRVV